MQPVGGIVTGTSTSERWVVRELFAGFRSLSACVDSDFQCEPPDDAM